LCTPPCRSPPLCSHYSTDTFLLGVLPFFFAPSRIGGALCPDHRTVDQNNGMGNFPTIFRLVLTSSPTAPPLRGRPTVGLRQPKVWVRFLSIQSKFSHNGTLRSPPSRQPFHFHLFSSKGHKPLGAVLTPDLFVYMWHGFLANTLFFFLFPPPPFGLLSASAFQLREAVM